jgi:phosphoglycerate kinase
MMYSLDKIHCGHKRVLIRADLNVPMNEHLQVTDDSRIRASAKTIRKVVDDGGIAIVMSHLGRPKNGPENKFSLRHVVSSLEKALGRKVHFAEDCIGEIPMAVVDAQTSGGVVLLENLRFYKEEEAGDEFFAGQLARVGDIYVNDAFGTAHRAHASTAVIARFFPTDKYFGYLMEDEVTSIEKVLNSAEHPVTAIIGGSKVSSKITIIENLLPRVDHLIIGGGMAYTFFKALGGSTGNSLVEEDKLDLARRIIDEARKHKVDLHLPEDSFCGDGFKNEAEKITAPSDVIPEGFMGLDIGDKAAAHFRDVIMKSKVILWNGPMGVFEFENFSFGTKAVAEALAMATANGAFTLVGGGDSVAAVNQFHYADKVSYVSTGGGAMLEALEGIKLPGIAAIEG